METGLLLFAGRSAASEEEEVEAAAATTAGSGGVVASKTLERSEKRVFAGALRPLARLAGVVALRGGPL